MQYVIQHIPGASDLVQETLDRALPHVTIIHADDSAIVFESSAKVTQGMVPFANNLFQVITSVTRKSIPQGVRALGEKAHKVPFPPMRANRGFRLMVHVDGSLAQLDRTVRTSVERDLALRTKSRVEARGNCQEYWIIGRRGFRDLLLCARIPKTKGLDLAKGTLSPELSAMLVALSQPHKLDVFLDPFGGSGAIVLARTHQSGKQFIYSDTALDRHRPAMPKTLTHGEKVRLLVDDATELPHIEDGSISVIVTDPPWGEFEKLIDDYPEFARRMAGSFDRVLHPRHGRFVVLSSRRNAPSLNKALKNRGFDLDRPIEILVNGHPASVLVGRRAA